MARGAAMGSISIGDVPPRQRLAYLHDFVASHIAGLAFEPVDIERFDYALSARRIGTDLMVSSTRYSAVTGSRRPDMLADGRGDYVLSIHDTDYEVEIGGRLLAVGAGDVMIVDESSPYRFRLPGTGSRVMLLERRRLLDIAPHAASAPAHHFSRAAPMAALVAGYADLLRGLPEGEPGELPARHVYEMVAGLIGQARERPDGGMAAARLELVKADIDRLLAEPGLGLAAVARRHRISPRYMQQMFAGEGSSFSDYVRERRLERAWHSLRDAGDPGKGIAAIAFEVGFGDLSSFNRAFRKRFGTTPRDVRADAMRRRTH